MSAAEASSIVLSDHLLVTRSQPKLYKLICQFFMSTMKLLSEPLDGPMCGFVLRRLRASVPLIGKKIKLGRKILMCSLGFFGSEAKSPRVQAIMLIREMVLKLGDTMTQMCMKVHDIKYVLVETIHFQFSLFLTCVLGQPASFIGVLSHRHRKTVNNN